MTLKQLQRYLETEKWRETAKRGTDVCGSYARCAYCNRYDEYPCAEAYNRYSSAPVKEEGEWLLPEPPVRRVFGGDPAPAEAPHIKEAPKPERVPERGEAIPVQHLVRKAEVREPVLEVPAPPVAPVLPREVQQAVPETTAAPVAKRGGVLVRGRQRGDKTRLLVLTRKRNYGEAER